MRKYLLGIGLVLITIHNPNQPLLEYVFLPQVGFGCILLSVLLSDWKKFTMGSKWVWVPLVLLLATISLSGFANATSFLGGIAPTLAALAWFGVYLVARAESEYIGKPMAAAVIIGSISIAVQAFTTGGVRGGGLISPTNYDIAAAVMVFGTLLSPPKWRWWVAAFGVVGIFFSGAEEGWVGIAAITLVCIWIKDYSWKMAVPAAALIVALVVATPHGITRTLYIGDGDYQVNSGANPSTSGKLNAVASAFKDIPDWQEFNQQMDIATGYRWLSHWRINPIKPFGYGYNMTEFYPGIPHNIFLIIIEQVGVLGLVGWVAASVAAWKRQKQHYIWAGVLSLGMFDHYLFTQWSPVWFALAAMSASQIHMFREEGCDTRET